MRQVVPLLAFSALWLANFSRHVIPIVGVIPHTGTLERVGLSVATRMRNVPGMKPIASFFDRVLLPLANPILITPSRHVWNSKLVLGWRGFASRAASFLRYERAHLKPFSPTNLGRFISGLVPGLAIAALSIATFSIPISLAIATVAAFGVSKVAEQPLLAALHHRRVEKLDRNPDDIGIWGRFKQRHHIEQGPIDRLDSSVRWWKVPFVYRQLRVSEAKRITDSLLPAGCKDLIDADGHHDKVLAYWNLVAAVKASMLVHRKRESFDESIDHGAAALVVGVDTPGPLAIAEGLHKLHKSLGLDIKSHQLSIKIDRLSRLTRRYYMATQDDVVARREAEYLEKMNIKNDDVVLAIKPASQDHSQVIEQSLSVNGHHVISAGRSPSLVTPPPPSLSSLGIAQ